MAKVIPGAVPNYAQLTQTDIGGQLRNWETLALNKRSANAQAAASRRNAQLAAAQEARLAQGQAFNQNVKGQEIAAATQTAKRKRMLEDQAMEESALLQTYAGLGDAPLPQRKAAYKATMDQLRANGVSTITDEDYAVLEDDERFMQAETKIAGQYDMWRQGKSRSSGTASGKYNQRYINTEDGTVVNTTLVQDPEGGVMRIDEETREPVKLSELTKGGKYVPEDIYIAQQKSGNKLDYKTSSAAMDSINAKVDAGKRFIAQASVIEEAADKLSDADVGIGKAPVRTAQELGLLANALAGRELFDVDKGNLAIKDVLESLTTQSALLFTAETKGAISNTEMDLFLRAVPTLIQSKEGLKVLAKGFKALGNRAYDAQKYAMDLRDINNGLLPTDLQGRVDQHFRGKNAFSKATIKEMSRILEEAQGAEEEGTAKSKVKFLGWEDADS